MRGPEGKIQDKCISWLRRNKWQVVKIVICSRPGWPDTYAVKGGHQFWIEFKKPNVKPEPLQEEIHKQIRAAGGQVFVVDDVAKFKEMVILLTSRADGPDLKLY